MKILLAAVNAKYIHSNPAVYSLKAYAKEFEEQVEIGEFTINHYPDSILQEIYKKRPDVVAFSCYIWNLPVIELLIRDLPQILPNTKIWAGGPEVSYDVEEFLQKHSQVQGVMIGEGEETFRELAGYYIEKDRNLEDIKGIAWRDSKGMIRINPPRPLLNMDEMPFLYENLQEFKNRIIYYESSRGCPFSCSYCLSSIDKSVRFRSVEKVTQELQFFMDHKVPQVKFVDRTFNCRHSHSMAIWKYMKEHDNGVTNFHFEIAADLLNEEELALLNTMRPGLVQLEIGVQSTNVDTIQEIDRVMDFEHLSQVVRRVQEGENIHQHLDLIAGLPQEDLQSFQKSFNDVYALRPDQLQLGFLKVLKGSKMHRKVKEYGLCYHQDPVYEVFRTNWISYDDILQLKSVEEMVEVYYNSGQFARTIRHLEQEFSDAYEMYAALGAYYERKALDGQSHSRMNRFLILRDFIQTITKDPVYDELLTLDVYLRENSKSRPVWAEDLSSNKAVILEFYKNEEVERTLLPDYTGFSAKQMMNMTHLERFHWDVTGDCAEKECWILFDYRRRNALNQDAFIMDVTRQMRIAVQKMENRNTR